MDFNYSYNLNHARNGVDIFSHHLYDGTVHDIEQFNRGDRKANEYNLRLGMDYKLSDQDKVALTYTSQITAGVNNNEISNGTFSNSANQKEEDRPIQMHNVLLNYSTGFGLKMGIEYTHYRDLTFQHFLEKKEGKEGDFIAYSTQDINRYRLSADQNQSIGTWTLTILKT